MTFRRNSYRNWSKSLVTWWSSVSKLLKCKGNNNSNMYYYTHSYVFCSRPKIINFLSLFFSYVIGDNETFCLRPFCTHLLQFSLLFKPYVTTFHARIFACRDVKDTACTFLCFFPIFLPIHISIWPLLTAAVAQNSKIIFCSTP